jgi:hypothetical protein
VWTPDTSLGEINPIIFEDKFSRNYLITTRALKWDTPFIARRKDMQIYQAFISCPPTATRTNNLRLYGYLVENYDRNQGFLNIVPQNIEI